MNGGAFPEVQKDIESILRKMGPIAIKARAAMGYAMMRKENELRADIVELAQLVAALNEMTATLEETTDHLGDSA
jgi:hypothetical protein